MLYKTHDEYTDISVSGKFTDCNSLTESSPTTIHRLESSPTGKFAAWKIHRSAIRRKENSPILQLIADDLFIKNHETWKTFTH